MTTIRIPRSLAHGVDEDDDPSRREWLAGLPRHRSPPIPPAWRPGWPQLVQLDPERVRLRLFARCAQESLDDPTVRGPARRLAP